MLSIFTQSFGSVLLALGQIFSIVLLAGILVRKKIITQAQITALSKVTVYVFLPALIFANILLKFQPGNFEYWWTIPLAAAILSLLGIGFNSLFFLRKWPDKKNLLPLGSFQNAGYLVLPLGQLLYPEQFGVFSLYVFLYILGYNPLLWSIGKVLISSNSTENEKFAWKSFFSPPMLTTLFSILIVLIGLRHYVPKPLINASALLGSAAVPVATFILGATLGSVELKKSFSFYEIFSSLSTKYILIPVFVFIILHFSHLSESNPLLADFFVIESAVAPATGLIMMLRTYGGNVQKIGTMVLVSYVFSLIATPFWVALWRIL